jgi:hypothetical protein
MFPPWAPFFPILGGQRVGGLPPGEARLRPERALLVKLSDAMDQRRLSEVLYRLDVPAHTSV